MSSLNQLVNEDGQIVRWPKKQQDKQTVIEYLSTKFTESKIYHEREVNEVLKNWHTFSDWAILRRELVERGFLKRNFDGTKYTLVKNL